MDELIDTAGAVGIMKTLVQEIIDQSQVIRDQVEQRLRKSRLEEEQVLRLVVADAAREERLEDMARKRAAWR